MTQQSGTTLLEQIEALEHKRQQAMMAKDIPTLSSLLDDDLIYVHSTGRLMSKSDYLDHLRSDSFSYEAITPEAGGRHQDANGAFVLVRHVAATMKIGDKRIDTILSVMTVWKQVHDTWRLVGSVSAKMAE